VSICFFITIYYFNIFLIKKHQTFKNAKKNNNQGLLIVSGLIMHHPSGEFFLVCPSYESQVEEDGTRI
jgi:hypothetical protein